jgi:7-cyano-7-deazaguanine synthase
MNEDNSLSSCVVLFSGGMDSTVVLHHAIKNFKNINTISFDYGQRHRRELGLAQDYVYELNCKNTTETLIFHTTLDVRFLGNLLSSSSITNLNIPVPKMKEVIGDPQTTAYVPNRNMMFLSIAASIAESRNASTILYGAAKADDTSGFWDCTQEFRTLINQILSLNRRNQIKIEAPLIDKSKKEIIEYGIDLEVNFSKTHTCYVGNSQACGECPSCAARIAGFIQAKKIDPVKYSREIDWKKYNCNLI